MDLTEAKDIVRQMSCGSVEATMKLPNTHLHSEAIRQVCAAACYGDKEAQGVQTCIPDEMAYMGLYPHIMEKIDIIPEGSNKRNTEMLDKIFKARKEYKERKNKE